MPESSSRRLTYSAALNEALRLEMRRDPTIFVMGEDVGVWGDGGGVFGVTRNLREEFGPERVRDTPISEEGFTSLGVGAALAGMRPVVELMYFDFVTLAMGPLIDQAAKLRYMSGGQASVPLVLRSNIGASGGKAAQHSQSLESLFIHIPGLKVVAPSTPYDAKGLLIHALRQDDPVVFLEHKLLYFVRGEVPEDSYSIPFGSASVRRSGADVSVVATHTMVDKALQLAARLDTEGIDVEVIDLRTLTPLDTTAVLDSVAKTGRLVICHEAVQRGGWGAEVAAAVVDEGFDLLDAPIIRVGSKFAPVPYAAELEEEVVVQDADLEAAIRRSVVGIA